MNYFPANGLPPHIQMNVYRHAFVDDQLTTEEYIKIANQFQALAKVISIPDNVDSAAISYPG